MKTWEDLCCNSPERLVAPLDHGGLRRPDPHARVVELLVGLVLALGVANLVLCGKKQKNHVKSPHILKNLLNSLLPVFCHNVGHRRPKFCPAFRLIKLSTQPIFYKKSENTSKSRIYFRIIQFELTCPCR